MTRADHAYAAGVGNEWEPEPAKSWPTTEGIDSFLGEPMTIVAVALAADGVAMATDSRETIQGTPTSYLDGAQKLVRIGSLALIGVAAGGEGIDVLVERGTRSGEIDTTAATTKIAAAISTIATSLHRKPFLGIVAGTNPTPSMLEVKAKLDGGTYVYETTDLSRSKPYRCVGIPYLGHFMLEQMFRRDMDVVQAAALCLAAVKASAATFQNVGGPLRVEAIRTDGRPWSASDVARTHAVADQWFVELKKYTWAP